jgi:hypothetical protein
MCLTSFLALEKLFGGPLPQLLAIHSQSQLLMDVQDSKEGGWNLTHHSSIGFSFSVSSCSVLFQSASIVVRSITKPKLS